MMALNDRDESDLQELIGLFANADDDATRKQMLTYMKGINVPRGYELLLTLLDQPEQAKYTLEAMLTYRHKSDDATREDAHNKVANLLQSDDDALVVLAIQTLVRIKHKSPVIFNRMLDVIEDSKNEAVHLASVEALPDLVDGISEQQHKRMNKLLDALWRQKDLSPALDDVIDKTRQRMEAQVSYRTRECFECGRGSKDAELKQCLYCDRFVCTDHSYKGFCTKEHNEAYQYERTGSRNPRDW